MTGTEAEKAAVAAVVLWLAYLVLVFAQIRQGRREAFAQIRQERREALLECARKNLEVEMDDWNQEPPELGG